MKKQWNDLKGGIDPSSALDFLPETHLRELQFQRLKAITERAYDHVELYRQRMNEKGIHPTDLKDIRDIEKLPFTEKTDLRDTYPYGLFASPLNEVVRLHASSGTTGKPIVVGYTEEDLHVWRQVICRSLAMAGLSSDDVIQNSYGYGLFTGGLGLHNGVEALGATVIPTSGGNSERQISVMRDFGVTAICCTPSYFLHLIETGEKLGIDLKELPLRKGIFGAEPWTEGMRSHIESSSGIQAHDIYGLSEIIGPGVGMECCAQDGLHIFEDHFMVEIVDPETGLPVPDGREGELVLTTLSKQAMPILRYRTHDITRIINEPCKCGRTIRRIQRIGRRSDDMFIIRGVNVFPSQIETGILRVENTVPHYQIILTRNGSLDSLEVKVEVTPDVFSDKISEMEDLRRKLQKSIEQIINIRADVRLVQPNSIERSQGKAKRVLDLRNL